MRAQFPADRNREFVGRSREFLPAEQGFSRGNRAPRKLERDAMGSVLVARFLSIPKVIADPDHALMAIDRSAVARMERPGYALS